MLSLEWVPRVQEQVQVFMTQGQGQVASSLSFVSGLWARIQ